jgi:hypothetical protein
MGQPVGVDGMMTIHLAKTADGQEFTVPGFDYDRHDRWVLAGHCPVVSRTKAWCGRPYGHPDYAMHGSPWRPAEERGPDYVEWRQ